MTMDSAILGAWFYVPFSVVQTRNNLAALQAELTFRSKYAEPGSDPVRMFTMEREGFIGVPRAFGRRRYPHLPVIDQTSKGSLITGITRFPDPNHPRVQDPVAQAKFMNDLLYGMENYREFNATAPTGSGKTYCSLWAAGKRGRSTLILVHLERLMDQWVNDSIIPGLGVDPSRVGVVQQGRCEFRDKDFVVGLLHSVILRDTYPKEFFSAFGTVLVDEVHKTGSEFFSQAMGLFDAEVRVGLSATMKRSDGGDRIYFYHLGAVSVKSTAAAMPCKVFVLHHHNGGRIKAYDPITVASVLTKMKARNRKIARVIKRFYDSGRDALIVSSSTEHLDELMKLAHELGVPYRVMGRFYGQLNKGKVVVTDEWGQKRTKKVKQKRTGEQLRRVKEQAQLIFAAYGMMTEGIDIPRLSAGIDATPQGKATQVVGRIRRPLPGKKEPTWITILDTDVPTCGRMFEARLSDYLSTGCEVFDYGQGVRHATAA